MSQNFKKRLGNQIQPKACDTSNIIVEQYNYFFQACLYEVNAMVYLIYDGVSFPKLKLIIRYIFSRCDSKSSALSVSLMVLVEFV